MAHPFNEIGPPQHVEAEGVSSSGASEPENATKTNGFSMIHETHQSGSKSYFELFGANLGGPKAPEVSLGHATGSSWGRHGSPWDPLGTSGGVLWVFWELLDTACEALAVLEIIEKQLVFVLFLGLEVP